MSLLLLHKRVRELENRIERLEKGHAILDEEFRKTRREHDKRLKKLEESKQA